MKKVLGIASFFLMTSCGGNGNIVDLILPDSISALRKEVDYILVTGRTERKWVLFTGDGKRIDSGKMDCTPEKTMVLDGEFTIFCEEITGAVVLYKKGPEGGEPRKAGETRGLFTGVTLCGDSLCFSAYEEGRTTFYKWKENLKEMFASEGLCLPAGFMEDSLFYICGQSLYRSGEKITDIPGETGFFPDPVSGFLLSSGREIKRIEGNASVPFLVLRAQPLSFLPFEKFIAFFDILGYARLIKRENLCEIKGSKAELKERSELITVSQIRTNECFTTTEEWRIEYEGIIPGSSGRGKITAEKKLVGETDFEGAGVKEGDILLMLHPFEGEFSVERVERNALYVKEGFREFPAEVSYSVRCGGFCVSGSTRGLYGRTKPGEVFSSPFISFRIDGSPQRGDYAIISTYEYGENLPLPCGAYPVSATTTGLNAVYVLNQTVPSVTVLDLQAMKVLRIIR